MSDETTVPAPTGNAWRNALSYAATALEGSSDNGDRYCAAQIRAQLVADGVDLDMAHNHRHIIFTSGYGKGQQSIFDRLEAMAQEWDERGYGMYERCATELRDVMAEVRGE